MLILVDIDKLMSSHGIGVFGPVAA
jgi:hypothetical protein